MKKLILFLCLLSLAQLHADNWLYNGNFADGTDHWRGNGQAPADFAPDPLQPPDPLLSKGLIIPLRDVDWRKIQQDFKGKLSSGVLTITYFVTPDCSFSAKSEDYANVPDHINYEGWYPFNIPTGSWIVFISDFGADKGTYYIFKPKFGSSKPMTIKTHVNGLTPYSDKTICLAFPPGTGKVIILSITLDDK